MSAHIQCTHAATNINTPNIRVQGIVDVDHGPCLVAVHSTDTQMQTHGQTITRTQMHIHPIVGFMRD